MFLSKVLARAGLGSRRSAIRMVEAGRVKVDGRVVGWNEKVFDGQSVAVDGKPLPEQQPPRLWMYHKPRGEIVTAKDAEYVSYNRRETVFAAIARSHPTLPRLISVGRLDVASEGLLLLTNAGELAHYLEHPRAGLTRVYRVRALGLAPDSDAAAAAAAPAAPNNAAASAAADSGVAAAATPTDVGSAARRIAALNAAAAAARAPTLAEVKAALARGITTADGTRYKPIAVEPDRAGAVTAANRWLRMTLTEGKNREIRKVLDHLNLSVNRIQRIAYGEFSLPPDLLSGQLRELRVQPALLERMVDFSERAAIERANRAKPPPPAPAAVHSGPDSARARALRSNSARDNAQDSPRSKAQPRSRADASTLSIV